MNTLESPALMKITSRPTQVMARGAGSYLWDEAGRQYLDFIQGWAVNSLGIARLKLHRYSPHKPLP